MTFIKTVVSALVPSLLAALLAGLGAYIAVKNDMTILQVNQGHIITEVREARKDYKEVRKEVYEQEVRLALLERYARVSE